MRPSDIFFGVRTDDFGDGNDKRLPESPMLVFIQLPSAFCRFLKNALPTDRRTDRRTDGRTDGRMDGRTDGRKDGRTDGRTDGPTNQGIDKASYRDTGMQ